MRTSLTLALLTAASCSWAQALLWTGACNNLDRDAYAVVFNGAGTKLLSGSECPQARIRVWDAASGNLDWDYQVSNSLMCLVGVSFSSNGDYFATTEEMGNLLIFDNTGASPVLTHAIDLGVSMSNSLDFSPDGSKVAMDGSDGAVRIYDVGSGSLLSTITASASAIRSVDWSPNGAFIATGGQDGTPRLWDAATGSLLHAFVSTTVPIASVRVSADNSLLVVAKSNGAIHVYDVATHSQIALLSTGSTVHQADISDDNAWIVTGRNGQARAYSLPSGAQFAAFNSSPASSTVYSVDIQPGGTKVAIGNSNGDVAVFELAAILAVEDGLRLALTFDLLSNVVDDALIVRAEDGAAREYAVFGTNGALHAHGTWTGQPIDVSGLAPGAYLLRMRGAGTQGARQFIKR
ncbi:MAG: WD40 repeat domain-containing protein [Flavobacteriales bacterium]